jgi:CheY-like chemotaxis protein
MRILIIDDDPLSTFLTQTVITLAEPAHDITVLESGIKALEVMTDAPGEAIPELIFLDLNMPIMDGWAFLDALAPIKEKLQGKCTIYILTSSLDIADTLRVEEYAIVSGLIHKPITTEDVDIVFSQMQVD